MISNMAWDYHLYIKILFYLRFYIPQNCPDEEKGCSARDLVKVGSCRGENLLSNDIKYVMIG